MVARKRPPDEIAFKDYADPNGPFVAVAGETPGEIAARRKDWLVRQEKAHAGGVDVLRRFDAARARAPEAVAPEPPQPARKAAPQFGPGEEGYFQRMSRGAAVRRAILDRARAAGVSSVGGTPITLTPSAALEAAIGRAKRKAQEAPILDPANRRQMVRELRLGGASKEDANAVVLKLLMEEHSRQGSQKDELAREARRKADEESVYRRNRADRLADLRVKREEDLTDEERKEKRDLEKEERENKREDILEERKAGREAGVRTEEKRAKEGAARDALELKITGERVSNLRAQRDKLTARLDSYRQALASGRKVGDKEGTGTKLEKMDQQEYQKIIDDTTAQLQALEGPLAETEAAYDRSARRQMAPPGSPAAKQTSNQERLSAAMQNVPVAAPAAQPGWASEGVNWQNTEPEPEPEAPAEAVGFQDYSPVQHAVQLITSGSRDEFIRVQAGLDDAGKRQLAKVLVLLGVKL